MSTDKAPVDISPARALQSLGRLHGASTALIYEDHTIDYRDLTARVHAMALALHASGVRKGDRVAYLGLNSPTFLVTYLAAAWVGAVYVPVNFRLAAAEIAYQLGDFGPRVLIVEPGHMPVIEEIDPAVQPPRMIAVDNDDAVPLSDAPSGRWEKLTTALARGAALETELTPLPRFADDLAALMYTSGTTGRPKGVMLTHGNIWWNSFNVDSVVDTNRRDINLAVAPLFHIGCLNSFTLRSLSRGGATLVRRTFDPAGTLADLVEHKVNTIFAVPAMFSAIAQLPEFADADLSQLRSAIVAGAPVPPSLVKEYGRRGVSLQQAWGLTETAPFATSLPPERTLERASSAGLPMPFTEIKIVDPVTGATLTEANAAGEICVRGPNVTPGYWANQQATDAAFDAENWFHSGDLGCLDEEGFLYIVDRIKDMVITGGENVYPAEVERVLVEYPGVTDAAVVGAPDPKWGEVVVAVLCVSSEKDPTLEEIRAFTGERLARYKLPKELLVLDSLPRNGSGKLDKVSLRKLAADGHRALNR
ncbi:long-chain-fatty-acid--CoA ligase [Rhodococcus sp. ABRD24]|uniref:acyl-CoA synthetase n=1 Tax=Rhodococcus sp. ABRD24 TaxID=2507582 RepID=UPI001038E3C0|nr:long-chain fatty acid--CoA ligase [Rhodococcus sp. ABRD24]QBJ95473.1 long-chain-fatty-acid--CoA ligase [Rhodococcus sp. ABRD24]